MGLDRTIRFPNGVIPEWGAICAQLARVGESPTIRMIDGLPAFPDEVPDAGWKELRIGTSGGMITLRRLQGALTCVIWGNADRALLSASEKLIWACAASGSGVVETPSGLVSADEFAENAGLTPV